MAFGGPPIEFTESEYEKWSDNIGEDWKLEPKTGQPLHEHQMANISSEFIKNVEFSKCLGSGVYGSVYSVTADVLNKSSENWFEKCLACKVIRLRNTDRNTINQALNDMRILRNLRHQNICNYLDIIGIKDRITNFPYSAVCLFFELCDGTLESIRRDSQPTNQFGPWILQESLSRHWFVQIVTALEYIHSNGVIHRDIKEQNILFRYGNLSEDSSYENRFLSSTFKLADFGISQMIPMGTDAYNTGQSYDIELLLYVLFFTGIKNPEDVMFFGSDQDVLNNFVNKCRNDDWNANDPQGWLQVSPNLKKLIFEMATNKISPRVILQHDWIHETNDERTRPWLPRYPTVRVQPSYHRWQQKSKLTKPDQTYRPFGEFSDLQKEYDEEIDDWIGNYGPLLPLYGPQNEIIE